MAKSVLKAAYVKVAKVDKELGNVYKVGPLVEVKKHG